MFNNPVGYNALPYKNEYTKDGSIQFTGFFIPAHEFSLLPEYLDERGVTNSVRFKAFYDEHRKLLSGKELIIYTSEHCFTPDEALLQQGDNLFDPVILSDRMTQIKLKTNTSRIVHMGLVWNRSGQNDESRTSVKGIESPGSKLLVAEPPLVDTDGKPYKNLYVIGLDSIDMGRSDSANDVDVSDLCAVVKRRAFGMQEPKYVAMYKDRPTNIASAYEMVMKLAVWYNAPILLEYTKISIQMYFKNKGMGHWFMKRPDFAMTDRTRRHKTNLVGLPATEAMIKHGLELINQYVLDYGWNIDFEEMCEQLLNYSYANKRKFDIVAALQMAEIADEDMSGLTPVKFSANKNEWQDFGYYTDDNGYKRFGVIPHDQQIPAAL